MCPVTAALASMRPGMPFAAAHLVLSVAGCAWAEVRARLIRPPASRTSGQRRAELLDRCGVALESPVRVSLEREVPVAVEAEEPAVVDAAAAERYLVVDLADIAVGAGDKIHDVVQRGVLDDELAVRGSGARPVLVEHQPHRLVVARTKCSNAVTLDPPHDQVIS